MIYQSKKKLNRAGIVIAITGGIGAGKSFVLKHFAKLGFQTLSLDKIANDVLKENLTVQEILKKEFPQSILVDGAVDKKLLSEIVFDNKNKLQLLNSVLHPIIRNQYENIINNARRRSIVIEIPLMIEALLKNNYQYSHHALILVKSNDCTRLKRVLLRNNMTEKKFNDIRASQLADNIKEKYADFIIENENSLAVFNQIAKFLHGRFKRNSFRYRNNRT